MQAWPFECSFCICFEEWKETIASSVRIAILLSAVMSFYGSSVLRDECWYSNLY
jgi:hypothetical protein